MTHIDESRLLRSVGKTLAPALLAIAISCAPNAPDPSPAPPPIANPAENLDFEEAAGALPAGWNLRGEGYTMELDSTTVYQGRNSLSIRSVAEGEAGMAGQKVLGHFAAGKHLEFSGFIRTEEVQDGYAGFWVRVDRGSEILMMANIEEADRPSGTTEWTRYTLDVPVDPNVTRVLFGVILRGAGRAWFDDLTISVDEVPTVEAAPWPDRPSRPQYATGLLDDAEMSVERDPQAPQEDPGRVAWIVEHHSPVRSLLAEDYSDLEFLEPLLQGKRIVQLGESTHGAAEFNLARVRLIKYLHENLDFDVVVFESSLYECYRANSAVASQEPELTTRQCLFSIWHTTEVVRLFEYFRDSRETDRPLLFAGIDIQESSDLGAAGRPEFLGNLLRTTDARYAEQVVALDSEFRAVAVRSNKILAQFLAREGLRISAGYRELEQYLTDNADSLLAANPGKEEQLLVARQTAASLARFVGQRSAEIGSEERVHARDQGMAINLDFVLNELYPGKKVVVWAHNAHVRHRNDQVEPDPSRTMGSWVAEGHRDELYTIGLYMYRGHAMLNDRSLYEITPVVAGSLESILHQPLKKYLFVDLAGQGQQEGTAWMYEPITAKSWGRAPKTMALRDQYDGILFVDTTTPPEYLLH